MIGSIVSKPLKLAAISLYLKHHMAFAPPARHGCPSRRLCTFQSRCFSTNSTPPTHESDLARVPTLVDGCDYHHWLVVMEPPPDYPLRDEIVNRYVKTLATALGSEEEAKKSIYSVSTKYYYAFSCKIPESLTHKIKSLPNVRWVLPDSFLPPCENGYGGEPFVDGEVVPYDEKYHADWLHVQDDAKCTTKTRSRKARRQRREKVNS